MASRPRRTDIAFPPDWPGPINPGDYDRPWWPGPRPEWFGTDPPLPLPKPGSPGLFPDYPDPPGNRPPIKPWDPMTDDPQDQPGLFRENPGLIPDLINPRPQPQIPGWVIPKPPPPPPWGTPKPQPWYDPLNPQVQPGSMDPVSPWWLLPLSPLNPLTWPFYAS